MTQIENRNHTNGKDSNFVFFGKFLFALVQNLKKLDNIPVGCTHLPTVYVPVATTRCRYHLGGGLGPQVNKFEQVSSDDHQMSVAWGVGAQV